MRIRLGKKLAEVMDGVNVNGYSEGDLLDVEPFGGRLPIAEGWAVPEPPATKREWIRKMECRGAALTSRRERRAEYVAHSPSRSRNPARKLLAQAVQLRWRYASVAV